jgi:hypothetical protein
MPVPIILLPITANVLFFDTKQEAEDYAKMWNTGRVVTETDSEGTIDG